MGTLINAFILFPPAVGDNAMLLETGDTVLLETGDKVLLE